MQPKREIKVYGLICMLLITLSGLIWMSILYVKGLVSLASVLVMLLLFIIACGALTGLYLFKKDSPDTIIKVCC